MRIGITGTHCTGKTTLAVALAKVLRLPLITEQTRTVAKKLGIEKTEVLIHDRLLASKFQIMLFFYQRKMEKYYKEFVSDRTMFDLLAYWYYYELPDYNPNITQIYEKQCTGNPMYDLLVYCPPEIPLQDDGFRLTDEASRLFIDQFLQKKVTTAEKEGIPVLRVSGSVEERVNTVLTYLKRKGVKAL